MRIKITVEAEVNHVEGKFVSKDEIADELATEIEGCDPGEVTVDESTYTVDDWGVSIDV